MNSDERRHGRKLNGPVDQKRIAAAVREILLAIVKTDQGGVLTVSRNGEADREGSHARVIGRVVANTR